MIGKQTWLFGALALAAAAPAYGAPSGAIPLPPSSQPPQSTPPTTQPAPPPATPPATTPPAPTSPSAQPAPGSQATADAKQTIERLHTRNVEIANYANIGEEKGTSPRVKELARKLKGDAERLDRDLAPIAQEHGVTLAAPATIVQAAKPALDELRAKNGADFDRFFAEQVAQVREGEVDALKAMRDRTPGKDAKLKKYLDDYENAMEEHRNLARDVRKDAQQRQGRTPGR